MDKNLVIGGIALVLILLAGAYVLQRENSKTVVDVPTTVTHIVDSKPLVTQFNLVVKGRKIVEGNSTLMVKQGTNVSITITADESDELHLHGYDKSTEFSTNTPATISFTADQSGRFPFEMEGSKTDLGELDVQP